MRLEQTCKGSSLVWTEVVVNPMYTKHGELIGWILVSRDISTQIELEEKLNTNQQRIKTAMESYTQNG